MPKSLERMRSIERKETIATPEVTQQQLKEIEQQQLRSRAYHEAGNQQAKLDAYLAEKRPRSSPTKTNRRRKKAAAKKTRLENATKAMQPIRPEDYIPGCGWITTLGIWTLTKAKKLTHNKHKKDHTRLSKKKLHHEKEKDTKKTATAEKNIGRSKEQKLQEHLADIEHGIERSAEKKLQEHLAHTEYNIELNTEIERLEKIDKPIQPVHLESFLPGGVFKKIAKKVLRLLKGTQKPQRKGGRNARLETAPPEDTRPLAEVDIQHMPRPKEVNKKAWKYTLSLTKDEKFTKDFPNISTAQHLKRAAEVAEFLYTHKVEEDYFDYVLRSFDYSTPVIPHKLQPGEAVFRYAENQAVKPGAYSTMHWFERVNDIQKNLALKKPAPHAELFTTQEPVWTLTGKIAEQFGSPGGATQFYIPNFQKLIPYK